jgi:hypothetical protein
MNVNSDNIASAITFRYVFTFNNNIKKEPFILCI